MLQHRELGYQIIGFVDDKTIGFRISRDDELAGVDETTHAETAYDNSALGGGGVGSASAGQAPEANLRQEVPA